MKYLVMVLLLTPFVTLADTVTYICNYPTWSNNTGIHKVKEKFEANFIVDEEAGKAYMLGNNGSVAVKLLESNDQLAFIQITATGNIITTTITSQLKSVHSRNVVIFGELLPSQYYGKCEVK